MCDTFVILNPTRREASTIFGKNSDREPNEAQEILHVNSVNHNSSTLNCTYIEIPQVSHTNEIILSKPFHMWGAEMGCNEYGVAIGNEAIFTNVKKKKNNFGLTGMDILRLALERSKNAQEALDTCISLVESYGQDACGGYKKKNFYYDNSFIIADSRQAFKLETADRSWAYKRIEKSDSISNGITIDKDYDNLRIDASNNIVKPKFQSSFRNTFVNRFMDKMTHWKVRQACTMASLSSHPFEISSAIETLNSHEISHPLFDPSRSSARSVCMHASGQLNPSQTTGSMIAELNKESISTVWLSGTSMPCMSVYKPFFFGTPISKLSPTYSPDESLWWRAERLHRWIASDYKNRFPQFQKAKLKLQNKIIKEYKIVKTNGNQESLQLFSQSCWNEHADLVDSYSMQNNIQDIAPKKGNILYRYYWNRQNQVFKK